MAKQAHSITMDPFHPIKGPFNIKWDYEFHIDPSGNSTDDNIKDFYHYFNEYYKIPFNQKIIGHLYGIQTFVYLWNAGFLKFSKKKADQFDIVRKLKDLKVEFGIDPDPETRYLLRIDDYPRFDIGIEGYMEFHDISKEFDIDYLIGVTPFLTDDPFEPSKIRPEPLDDEEIDTLTVLRKDGVEFGMHGITHRSLYKRYHTESVGLPGKSFFENISDAKKYLQGLGLDIYTYIPPFNTFDMKNLESIRSIFKIITGGPEAIGTIGIKLSPSCIHDLLYIPVYGPFYDKCSNLVETIRTIEPLEGARMIPLTVHWSWEKGTKFQYYREMCEEITGKTMKWKDISATHQ